MSKHWDPHVIRGGHTRRRGRRRLGAAAIWLAVLGGVLLGLAIAWAWPQAEEPAAPLGLRALPSEGRGRGEAVRVIDGDTFDFGGMRVRVADIDTPETEGRCAYETQLAARATRRMRALLGEGPFELHRPPNGRDEDRYGRKLRIVTRGGRSLGDQLVAEGLARTWTGRREPWC